MCILSSLPFSSPYGLSRPFSTFCDRSVGNIRREIGGLPFSSPTTTATSLFGYLDKISQAPVVPDKDKKADPLRDSSDYNKMDTEDLDRFGPGTLQDFVDFEEFDGGDGQMGVAGDGQQGLEKIGRDSQQTVVKPRGQGGGTSRDRSAKNAWGTSTGYAEELVSKGVDTARAQQFENYANQIELNKVRKESAKLTEMDEVNHIDEDWRTMAKFGVDRVQNFDLTEAFGPVIPDVNDITEVITLKANPNGIAFHTIPFRNPYMGFLDFRAALSDDTPKSWQVEPEEGNIGKSFDTDITVRFRPDITGTSEGYLVLDTEEFKRTYKLVGLTA